MVQTCHLGWQTVKSCSSGARKSADYGRCIVMEYDISSAKLSIQTKHMTLINNAQVVLVGGGINLVATARYWVRGTDSRQWYAGPLTPTSWSIMKTAIVGDILFHGWLH